MASYRWFPVLLVTPAAAEWRCDFQNEVPWGLPLLGDTERTWPMTLRLIMYLMGLGYLFLGVGLISDIFMSAIEKVTSLRRRVVNPQTGRTSTVYVWNATVANLTLMALGSSAPEILLSLIEISSNNMLIGGLGAGTIVGSAAFNLLVISAVCVCAIPDGEVRSIKMVPVYIITATFSVFAYLWLMFILLGPSPDVVESWEAILTLLFCPMLVSSAYLADVGKITFGIKMEQEDDTEPLLTVSEDATPEELAVVEKHIREEHGENLTNEQVVKIMAIQYRTRRNKAYYAQAALQNRLKGKKLAAGFQEPVLRLSRATNTMDDVISERMRKLVSIGFEAERYAFMEGCGKAKILVVRTGPSEARVSVHYKTRDGTAHAGSDYEPTEGVITFEHGETEKPLYISIIDDNAYEDDEDFFVDLYEPFGEDAASAQPVLSDLKTAILTIMDDDEPGKLRFQVESVTFEEGLEDRQVPIVVERFDGGAGTVSCKYTTGNMKAIEGIDYEGAKGKIELGNNVMSTTIWIKIKASGRYTSKCDFNLILHDPEVCTFAKDTDGGTDECICNITIKGKSSETRDKLINMMSSRVKATKVANQAYRQQFYDAIFSVGGGDDDDDNDDDDDDPPSPSILDYFLHSITVPMKLIFAIVPPVDYCGGWLTFSGSLLFIAVITALVGDMANLVGCCLGLEAEITAITFVALGTSLPDTFASKTAAEQDPNADNSIGNVTGSNSVNVFLGIGLSWGMAAIYWQSTDAAGMTNDDHWMKQFAEYSDEVQQNIRDVMGDSGKLVFMVPAGTIWFNLSVFVCNAFIAIQHLLARRKKWGGELGGPKKGFMGQWFSAAFLVLQWCIYVGASSAFCIAQK